MLLPIQLLGREFCAVRITLSTITKASPREPEGAKLKFMFTPALLSKGGLPPERVSPEDIQVKRAPVKGVSVNPP